ncbi:site-specific DNA-methyltransferase [Aureispira sp. CCB-E]|uniref:DNA-methyltransferase n=1 Tax=Aureispira sp. CCB-E TaxID=3051121 RepID=UPI002868FB92|nr:site-specific DNA-methyltransferase [Aureispira sp. CCB-E]WMX15273.1 site-specific DNA-methyltransferase [Aureispira sp. CCB-E]
MNIDLKLNDCLDGLKQINHQSIDAIITDPPYFCGMTHNGTKGTYSDLNMVKPFFKEVFKQWKRVLKANGEIYVFCDWRTYPLFYELLQEVLTIRNRITWDKISGAGCYYSYSHEDIIFCTNPSPQYKRYKKGQNVWRMPAFSSGAKKTNGEKVHPTQKPIELIEKLVLSATENEGDTVLDCFAGSGTTAVACKRLNRNFVGFEIQEKYYNIALERIKAVPS